MNAYPSESGFERVVFEQLRKSGYHVKLYPRMGLFKRQGPDIIAEIGSQRVAIECKSLPVTLSAIAALKTFPVDRAILCIPEGTKSQITGSVRAYADQMNIRICESQEIPQAIASLA